MRLRKGSVSSVLAMLLVGLLAAAPPADGEPPQAPPLSVDFDRDGDLDLIVAPAGPAGVVLWLEAVDGEPAVEHRVAELGSAVRSLTAADLDDDGDLDLVVLLEGPPARWLCLERDGAGGFTAREEGSEPGSGPIELPVVASAPPDAVVPRDHGATAPPPQLQISPGEWAIGNVRAEQLPLHEQFVIANVGETPVAIRGVGLRDRDASAGRSVRDEVFTLRHDCTSLRPGETCTADVVFRPSSPGGYAWALSVVTRDSEHAALDVPLSGTLEDGEILAAALSAPSCPSLPVIPTIIPPTTKILEPATLDALLAPVDRLCSAQSPDCILVFTAQTPQLRALRAGDVIVGGIHPKAPAGLLRKVGAVTRWRFGSLTFVFAGRATLEDAIQQAAVCATVQVPLPDATFASAAAGSAGVGAAAAGYGFRKTVRLYESGGNTIDLEVWFAAGVNIVADAYISVWIWESRLKEFSVELATEAGAKILVHAETPLTWETDQDDEQKIPVGKFPTIAFAIGPLPVVIQPEMSVRVGAEVSFAAAFTTEAWAAFEMAIGAQYLDGAWSPILRQSADHGFTPPTVEVKKFSLKGYARPEFMLRFYDAAGPYVNVDLWGQGVVEPAVAPWWKIEAGIEPHVGVRVEVLGWTPVDLNWSFGSMSWLLAKGNTISGRVATAGGAGIDGVLMKGLPGDPVTSGGGDYEGDLTFGWTGYIVPEKSKFTFDPRAWPEKAMLAPLPSQTVNFTALGDVTISGTVSDGVSGIGGVNMRLDPPHGSLETTHSDGSYTLTVPHGWIGTVKPDKECWSIPPHTYSVGVTTSLFHQDYVATRRTFEASGHVTSSKGTAIAGASLTATRPDGTTVFTATSGAAGYYNGSFACGEGLTITPVLGRFEFDPGAATYTDAQAKVPIRRDFAVLTVAISGSVNRPSALGGVTMDAAPNDAPLGDARTDAAGAYAVEVRKGWTGTVTPVRPGYRFTPGSAHYDKPVVMDTKNQDYSWEKVQVVLQGQVRWQSSGAGIPGVSMRFEPDGGAPFNQDTDVSGRYGVVVDWGWSGTVTPALPAGLPRAVVEPSFRRYESVTSRLDHEDYLVILLYEISGCVTSSKYVFVPVPGVLMIGLPDPIRTDGGGCYRALVKERWSGKVEPFKYGWAFDPRSRSYPPVRSDQKNQSYFGRPGFRIEGHVWDTRTYSPLGGVSLTFSSRGAVVAVAVTDPTGYYGYIVPVGWSGRVTPSKDGWEFSPELMDYTLLDRDVTQDYKATPRSSNPY